MFSKNLIILCLLLPCLSGCTERASRTLSADMAAQGAFKEWRLATSSFVLYSLWRPAQTAAPAVGAATSRSFGEEQTLHVYVEGDGLAWESARRPSRDPTPDTPVVLHLAAADPTRGPVLYLARPCQYVRGDDARLCRPEYWTSGRLGEKAIASLNEAVDMVKARSGAARVVLVGYSGGGGAVALMAARRDDVVFLGTVAGLLDHAAWTAYHKVSPLRTSLNAVDVAPSLRSLPQRHVTGGKDSVVPSEVNEAFYTAVGAEKDGAAQCVTVPGMTHGDAWDKVWQYGYY